MQATIASTTRITTTEESATDPSQSGTETRLILRIFLTGMPTLPPTSFYRGPATGWVPNFATVTETLYTGYGDANAAHYRTVHASGFLLKKDGTVGKLATDDTWRIYSTEDAAKLHPALHEAISQVVPAFQKGILP